MFTLPKIAVDWPADKAASMYAHRRSRKRSRRISDKIIIQDDQRERSNREVSNLVDLGRYHNIPSNLAS